MKENCVETSSDGQNHSAETNFTLRYFKKHSFTILMCTVTVKVYILQAYKNVNNNFFWIKWLYSIEQT